MKHLIPGLAALALLCTAALSALAQKNIDINQPQSTARPAPDWLKIIDQGQNDPRFKGYFTPAGVKIEIVADFPTVMNPVGMTFADDGTLFVLEWVPDPKRTTKNTPETFTFKDGTRHKVAAMKRGVADPVKVLRHTGDRGADSPWYDQAKVVLEEEIPSSILLHDGWLYLSGRGTVRRYKQSKPDGPYDVKEVIAQGFCGLHHHQVSGMTIGNDGWLYIASGDNDNVVEGSDGSRATLMRTGGVFRCRPDGSRMHVWSMGWRNPYRDVSFDTSFNMFHIDNDNEDGSKFTGCRLMHVAEESDFGWRLRAGAHCCHPDWVRGVAFGEAPGKLPPMLKTGRGSPAGLFIYDDTRFPEPFRGLIYYPDVSRKLIRAYKTAPRGSTFEVVEEFEFLKSDDPLFRPCQMVLGPDGAMYVCDWRTDSAGNGKLSGDGTHGRIYRLSWSGTEDQPAIALRSLDSWSKIIALPDDELIQALANEDFSDRQRAQRELVRRGDKNRPALLKLLADAEAPVHARIAVLGCLQSFWNDDVRKVFVKVLDDKNVSLRRLAVEGLGLNSKSGDTETSDALLRYLEDPEPSIRRAVFLALGRIGAPGTADSLTNAFKFEVSRDVYEEDGLLRAIERLGKPGIDALVSLSESGVDKDHDRVCDAFLALRTRAAAEAIPGLLKYPHLGVKQRVDLLRSYGNYLLEPPISLTPVFDYLAAHPKEPTPVKLACLEALAGSSVFRDEKTRETGKKLLETMLAEPDLRMTVVRLIESTRFKEMAPILVRILEDASIPMEERSAVVKTLGVFHDKSAIPALEKILAKETSPSPESTALDVESLRCLAALDLAKAMAPAKAFLDRDDASSRKEAILILGRKAEGARIVGERFLAKKLPRELLPETADALRAHAAKDPALAKMLTDVMKDGLLVSLDKSEIEKIAKMVDKQGDPQRGKELYLDGKKLACINCHRLEGAGAFVNVGPDLTRVWETISLEKLMEAIIDPGKEIKEGYNSYSATTTNGQVHVGRRIVQNDDELVLRDVNARDIHIAAKDLDELKVSKRSLMPDNLIAPLTFDQFIDLVAFLRDRSAQESLRGTALEFWVVGPFFGHDLKEAFPPESNSDPSQVFPGPTEGEKRAWQPRPTAPSGALNMRALFDKDKITVYAMTYVYSPRVQKVQMMIGSESPHKAWLNGAVVVEQATPRTGQEGIEVTLREGWNPVLAKVINVAGASSLQLQFVGGQGVRVSLKPEGN